MPGWAGRPDLCLWCHSAQFEGSWTRFKDIIQTNIRPDSRQQSTGRHIVLITNPGTNVSTYIHKLLDTFLIQILGFGEQTQTELSAAWIHHGREVLFQLAQEKPGQVLWVFLLAPDCPNSCCIIFLRSCKLPAVLQTADKSCLRTGSVWNWSVGASLQWAVMSVKPVQIWQIKKHVVLRKG